MSPDPLYSSRTLPRRDRSMYQRAHGLPPCQYGVACYRKNPQHWKLFDHPSGHSFLKAQLSPPAAITSALPVHGVSPNDLLDVVLPPAAPFVVYADEPKPKRRAMAPANDEKETGSATEEDDEENSSAALLPTMAQKEGASQAKAPIISNCEVDTEDGDAALVPQPQAAVVMPCSSEDQQATHSDEPNVPGSEKIACSVVASINAALTCLEWSLPGIRASDLAKEL